MMAEMMADYRIGGCYMSNENEKEMAVVIYARNLSEAEYYQDILEEAGVDVYVKDEAELDADGISKGIAVMVELDELEEAQLVIEQRSSLMEGLEDDLEFYDNEALDANDDFSDLTEIDDDNPDIM